MKPYEITVGVKIRNKEGEFEYFFNEDSIIVTTDETDFNKTYSGVIEEIDETGVCLRDVERIPFEYIVDIEKC